MYTTVLSHLWLVKYMDFQLHRELVPLKHTHIHVQVLCSVKVQGLKCDGKEECAMRYKREELIFRLRTPHLQRSSGGQELSVAGSEQPDN